MSSILKVSEIQDPTNGNTALSIGSTGIVSQGTPVGFSVSIRDGSNQTVSNTTYEILECTYESSNTRHFDTHSGWSNSNHYYTVPTGCGGYWMLHAWVELNLLPTQAHLAISKTTGVGSSGNFIGRISFANNTTGSPNPGLYFNSIANLSDGEIVKAEIYHNYGSDAAALEIGSYLRCAMQGWRLG